VERLIPGAVAWASNTYLDVHATLQPTPIHHAYSVHIKFRIGGEPRVHVLNPSLQPRRRGDRIPHTYAADEPCLYWPNGRQWAPWMLLATTIIPWTNEWLWHYESWRVTRHWDGGGIEHDANGPVLTGAPPGCYY